MNMTIKSFMLKKPLYSFLFKKNKNLQITINQLKVEKTYSYMVKKTFIIYTQQAK